MPTGVYQRVKVSPSERLTRRLERKPNGCLEWTGSTNQDGYGEIKVDGKNVGTHRLAWTLNKGPIPPGVHVLHRCDNPPCCDTDKCLFLGTPATNAADRDAKGRHYEIRKTHCPSRHLYDEANTLVCRDGSRQCRTCNRERAARYRALKLTKKKG